MTMNRTRRSVVAMLGLLSLSMSVGICWALEAVPDEQLSYISGQDGIEIDIYSRPSISRYDWTIDAGVTSVGGVAMSPSAEAKLSMGGVYINPVNAANVVQTGNAHVRTRFDVGAEAAAPSGKPAVQVRSDWDRARLHIDSLNTGSPAFSFGQIAFDSAGTFMLSNRGGLLSSAGSAAEFEISIPDAELFFRQKTTANSPELLMENLTFLAAATGATVGSDVTGLLVAAPRVDWRLAFDLMYEGNPGAALTASATDRPMLHYGWEGVLTDFEYRMRPGGVWYGLSGAQHNTTNRSEGLNFALRWNYDPEFALLVGEAGETLATRTLLRFKNWKLMPGATYAFNMPSVTLDVVRTGQGPGWAPSATSPGLCFTRDFSGTAAGCGALVNPYSYGGTATTAKFVAIPVEDNSLALIVRDASMPAYNRGVEILDDINADGDVLDTVGGVPETQLFNWGLMYVYGDIDANIFLQPGGKASASNGLHGDVLLTLQSFDANGDGRLNRLDWGRGTHFMIADTDKNLAFGWMNASWLVALDDVYLTLGASGVELETTNRARIHMIGQLGGASIPDASETYRIADMQVNLEMSAMRLTISPPPAGKYHMGYSGFLRIGDNDDLNFGNQTGAVDDGSFVSLAEPDRPGVDIRFGQLTGDIELRNGVFDLLSDAETPANRSAKLSLSQDMVFGLSATASGCPGGTCLPFVSQQIKFGSEVMGQIAIPGGQIATTFSLMVQ